MKKIIILILLVSATEVSAQQFYVYYGRILSSFDYENSQGEGLKNASRAAKNGLTIGYRQPLRLKNTFLNLGISYNRYGAKASDPLVDNFYEWDVGFVGLNAGVHYELLKQKSFFMDQDGFTFYLKGGISTEFLVQGTQTINNQLYDLHGVEQFDKPVFFVRGGVGATYCVSRRMAVFVEYTGGKSFLIFGNSDKERLQYITHSFGFGLMISLPKCDYCHSTL